MQKTKQTKKGAMTIEVLVATAVILVTVLTAAGVAQRALSVSKQALRMEQSSFLLEEGAEAVRSVRDNDWEQFVTLPYAFTGSFLKFRDDTRQWVLVENIADSTPVDPFTRTVVLDYVYRDPNTFDIAPQGTTNFPYELDPDTIFVTITVTWKQGQSNMSKSLSFYMTNLFN